MPVGGKSYSKSIIVGSVILSLFTLAACETPAGISKTNRDYYHHNRGSELTVINPLPVRPNPSPVQEVVREEPTEAAPHHHAHFEHVTHFDGCAGAFSLADERTGRVIQSGQGISTQEGIIVIDGRGNRTNQVINNVIGQSLIFQPNCGCQAGSMTGHSHQESMDKTCNHD
jgi:hypothetical protein